MTQACFTFMHSNETYQVQGTYGTDQNQVFIVTKLLPAAKRVPRLTFPVRSDRLQTPAEFLHGLQCLERTAFIDHTVRQFERFGPVLRLTGDL